MAANRPRTLAAVVLAGGRGVRFRSKTPKVLQPLCGRPLLWHAVRNALAARPDRLVIVVPPGADDVVAAVEAWDLTPAPTFVVQREPLGTGHAVRAAATALGRVADVLVVGGDFDPVTPDDVRALVRLHRRTDSAAAILTTHASEPKAYARIVRDGARLLDIVEGSDAPKELLASHEVATLVYAFRRADLLRALPRVGRRNRQREYYLNSVFPMFLADGERVSVLEADTGGLLGPNSQRDLAAVAGLVRGRINAGHMDRGVAFVDPALSYIDVDVAIGAGTTVLPMTFLEGATRIGADCRIGPSARIADSTVGDGTEVAYSVVLSSSLGKAVRVGPFARLRPGSVLADRAYAGQGADIKNSTIGEGSKVPHFSYVGDARLGRDVNVGAGTVVVNYDGVGKYPTVIGDGAFIGSDTMLVAPLEIGAGAITGAGSVITKDVPDGALGIERAEQRNVAGYRKRRDARGAKKKSTAAKKTKKK
ncbi:MAG: bifunctional UDP-N-acetylglucosamine diphosphorylase/glucosamine-1-phosphate N-acetyltransferase GlmU [Actinomycetota bacterium]